MHPYDQVISSTSIMSTNSSVDFYPSRKPEEEILDWDTAGYTNITNGPTYHPLPDNVNIGSIGDPFVGEDIHEPEGDPYDHVLKPLLERDSRQCDAWKEEVQNILIFAGLFSAVVTAFIVESYPRLQANPTAPQANTTVPMGGSTPTFVPSRSNVRINAFWFISLVLSLTVALIGIITLQWLREHQRYDSSIKPSKALAIFNARSEGLRRWYVPQIFAALPLLLQAALVLFLAGVVDFLFALNTEVAIYVTAFVGIPILFLLATTLLPTLQLYTMHLPQHLSLSYKVPAPCPYRSPQALIARRGAIFSDNLFHVFAWSFAALYLPFVYISRLFVYSRKPFYGEHAPFSGDIDNGFTHFHRNLRQDRRDWMSIDSQWLTARTSYAAVVETPYEFRGFHRREPSLAYESLSTSTAFYDSIQAMKSAARETKATNDAYIAALYYCGEDIVLTQCQKWKHVLLLHGSSEGAEDSALLMQGRSLAFMTILDPYNSLPTDSLIFPPGQLSPDHIVEGLHNTYRTAYIQRILRYGLGSPGLVTIFQRWMESHTRLIVPCLLKTPEKLFECSSTPILSASWFAYHPLYYRGKLSHHNRSWMTYMSKQWTAILRTFIYEASYKLPLTAVNHVCITVPSCGGNFKDETILNLMRYILTVQERRDIKQTLTLLQSQCTLTENTIRDRPFVLIIACAYIEAVAEVGCSNMQQFDNLLGTVSSICCYSLDTPGTAIHHEVRQRRWSGLDAALRYIRAQRALFQTQTPMSFTPSSSLREGV